ncbi:MerR family transcriptional regulator [Burkholderia pseudomallei]|nr:MerR family transcriptional regulator [Burkholderia pseudomallei]MBF3716907.1 MerR family transcriptional regulator [Burkholderia pseudomallei]
MRLKIGELAKRCGLTVRTLHHYDAIGLLKPSARADNGYRLYDRNDIARLHQIQALRRFGLALADVGAYLAQPGTPLASIVSRQIAMLDRQIEQAARLRERLVQLHRELADGAQPELADWLKTLELMTMYDKYFSDEELARLPMYRNRQAPDPEWTALVDAVRALMDTGVAPEDERVRALSVRWMTMLVRDTNGDPRILAKLNLMHDREPSMQTHVGISPALRDYVLRAFSETKMRIYERYLSPEETRFMRANYGKRAMQWPQLMADVRDAIEAGVTPSSPQGRALAQRWLELFRHYAGDDPATQLKFREALANEPELMTGTWADDALLGFVREAMQHLAPARR